RSSVNDLTSLRFRVSASCRARHPPAGLCLARFSSSVQLTLTNGPTSEAEPAALSAAVAASAVGASAATVASVAGAAVPPAVFLRHWHSVSPVAGVPSPAVAAAFLVLVAVARLAFPPAAGIFCPASGRPCSADQAVLPAAGREDEPRCSVE